MEKAASLFFEGFKQGDEECKAKFHSLINSGKISWQPVYHKFWKSESLQAKNGQCHNFLLSFSTSFTLNRQIVTALLSSKLRSFSRKKLVRLFYVKGIAMKIVSFLCHSRQKKE